MALAMSLLVTMSLALVLLAWCAQARLVRRPPLRPASPVPVSILKPLRGRDPDLEANLLGFFRLGYPAYELVFAVADDDDPAAVLVERLIEAHPDVTARLIVSSRTVGLNPKVNNLALAASVARHDLLLISDSNVVATPGFLEEMVARIEQGAALVSALIRGSGESGVGGQLEALQLNTFVMGGVATWGGLFGKPCVVGKSMLLSRRTLQRIGGWEHLGRYLSEDQVCGEDVAALGEQVVVASLIDNRLGRLSVADFCRRHLRWARIRRHMTLAGYASEPLLNPVGLAALGLLLAPGVAAAAVLAGALTAMSLLAWSGERRLGRARRALAYAPLELLRSLLVLALWPVPFFSSHVTWRGRQFAITRRTLLVPRRLPERSLAATELASAPVETSA